jgi:hypothetical protein
VIRFAIAGVRLVSPFSLTEFTMIAACSVYSETANPLIPDTSIGIELVGKFSKQF